MHALFDPVFSSVRRAVSRTAAFVIVLSLVVPAPAFGADFTLKGADNVPVTRGDFLRAVTDALDIPLPKLNRTSLPAGVTRTMAPYVSVARTKGALAVFGDAIELNKTITRIEAAVVLTKMSGKGIDTKRTVQTFRDVRGDLRKEAAAVVVQQGWMRGNKGLFGAGKVLRTREAKLILKALEVTLNADPNSVRIEVPVIEFKPTISDERKKQELLKILSEKYLYGDKLGSLATSSGSLENVLDPLKDPYTTYFNEDDTENFFQTLKGDLEGIGTTVELVDGKILVIAPLRGSPAEKAGVLPKDELLAANGVSFNGKSLNEAVNLIRGPSGSTVVLRIRRDVQEFELTIVRQKLHIPDIDVVYQDGIAVVHVNQFGEDALYRSREYMAAVAEKKPKAIILDLRNNPGGYLDAAGSLVSALLPADSVYVVIREKASTYTNKTRHAPLIDSSVPVLVLVNKGTASAAEIVAGALQDTGRATIIGQKTFGKGTVQEVIEFTDNTSLKYTLAEWLTPDRHPIDKVGVQPDIVTELSTDRSIDAEMQRAMKELGR